MRYHIPQDRICNTDRHENYLRTATLALRRGWVLDHTTRYAPILPHRKFGSTVRYVRGEIRQFIADSKKTTAERLEAA